MYMYVCIYACMHTYIHTYITIIYEINVFWLVGFWLVCFIVVVGCFVCLFVWLVFGGFSGCVCLVVWLFGCFFRLKYYTFLCI